MITVTVSGSAGTGKSSVAYVVANLLLSMGFTVEVALLDGQSMHDVSEGVMDKLVDIKCRETISIVEALDRQVNGKVVPILTLVK